MTDTTLDVCPDHDTVVNPISGCANCAADEAGRDRPYPYDVEDTDD